MNKTEIKKELYKQNPEATFIHIQHGIAYYGANLKEIRVYFAIPVTDMGEASFTPLMTAKLLTRWLVVTE